MKRSLDQVATPGIVTALPAVHRQTSISSEVSVGGVGEETETNVSFHLISQNKALSQELFRNKRTIGEARKELDLIRRKTREMESLVSLIQRAWSQLDIDSSLLLDSLGDPVDVPMGGSTELLERFIHAGSKFNLSDPVNCEKLPKIDADEWSSSDEIEAAKKRAENMMLQSNRLDEEFGGQVEENLAAHSAFTLSLLERLCNAINEAGAVTVSSETVENIIEKKQHNSQILMLNDRITKLSLDIINLNAKHRIVENEKRKVEKRLDKLLCANAEAEQRRSQALENGEAIKTSDTVLLTSANGAVVDDIGTGAGNGGAKIDASVEKELKRQIAMLERQLAESESAKSHGEMLLTERLARPMAQTEVQVADMRKAMEELRQQCKQRVSQLLAESESHQEKAKNLEIALAQLEVASVSRIAEVVSLAEKEISTIKIERDAVQSSLYSSQADIVMTAQLKTQVSEYQAMDVLHKSEAKRAQDDLKMANSTLEIVRKNLAAAADREASLSNALHSKIAVVLSETTQAAADVVTAYQKASEGGNRENSAIAAASGVDGAVAAADVPDEQAFAAAASTIAAVTNVTTVLAANDIIVHQALAKATELQQELDNAQNNINDLILEIEAVCAEEANSKAQSARLMRQIAECQSMQRVALEENLKLQNQIEDLKGSKRDMENKTEAMKNVMNQQDVLLQQLRAAEQAVRVELHASKKTIHELTVAKQMEELKLQEARQNIANADSSIQSALKRNQELQARCDELTSQCESERKARLAAQRDVAKYKAVKKEKGGAASGGAGVAGATGGMKPEDADMLELALGMLRCSVCRDRFKSVVITRCFHLFCKECIDENLRNRHRKCPACGEKFGQDDVRNIYFTH